MIVIYVIFLLLVLAIVFYKFIFLRDPNRAIPPGDNLVSPADGKVILIQRFNQEDIVVRKGLGKIHSLTKEVSSKGYIISIFMSPFNVHVNRSPISGVIKHVKHKKGRFGMAMTGNALLENEHVETLIEGKKLKVKVLQIAGFLARRIKNHLNVGDSIKRGQKIGMITLGSQATLILPDKVKILVKEGQKVLAGQTIIATK